MKKIIAILLAACLCVGLCACTKSSGSSGENSSKSKNTSGYSTKEKYVDAYINMFYVEVVSKKEFKKMFPEQLLDYYGKDYIDDAYENYAQSAEKSIDGAEERFGDNYELSWEIVNVEDSTNYKDYSEEERQECLDRFGVEPEDHFMYTITVSITGVGDKDEYTNPGELIMARKIDGRWYFY